MIRSIQPDRYVVFGNPIAHSKSPLIHRLFAAETLQDIDYQAALVPLDAFSDAVHAFMEGGGKGANVTVPFKLQACALASQLSDRAKAAGAVNTLLFKDGQIIGDNTDGAGLVNDIQIHAGVALAGKRVLLLGAGGAARGATLPLLNAQIAQLVIANRTLSKAQDLVAIAQQFFPEKKIRNAAESKQVQAVNWEQLHALDAQFDVVINASSASLHDDMVPIPAHVFANNCLAYDMMYGEEPTQFLRFAKTHGAHIRDGLGMLVEQAAEAFFVWRGVRPETAPVLHYFKHGKSS